jgi:hypothetical protein
MAFFGGTGAMKLKRAKRPQNMFLFDPDFRYRLVDDGPSANAANTAEGHSFLNKDERKQSLFDLIIWKTNFNP